MTKKQDKKELRDKIRRMIQKASPLEFELIWIPKIMVFQLDNEKELKDTTEKNGEGLSKADAYPVTKLYNRIQKGGHISQEEADNLKTRLPKYWKQYASYFTK